MGRVALFPLGSGHVLAHPGACRTIAGELSARGHDPVLVYGGLERELIDDGVPIEPVSELGRGRLGPTSVGRAFGGSDGFGRLVEADLEVLERLRPDAAVVDCRLSAAIACEAAGIPFVSVVHFLRSTPWRAPEPLSRTLRRRARVRRAARLARWVLARDPLGLGTLARITAETRASFGLDPDRLGFDGDLVACTTTPLLDHTEGMPSHWRYVGPVTWSAPSDVEPPRRGARPLVYVTQGSTGSAATLARAAVELAREPVDVLVTTAALCDPRELEALAPNVRAERFLPGRACMEAADVAVVHGGHLTTIEAHLAGTPVVVVPHGYDQFVWANRAERLGTGLAVRPPSLPGAIRRAVRRVVRHDRYRRAAAPIADDLRRWDGPANVAGLVEELLPETARVAPAEAAVRAQGSGSSGT
jgi:UDP:flavonoid glycosyltransferase YjiC (YdhE family)